MSKSQHSFRKVFSARWCWLSAVFRAGFVVGGLCDDAGGDHGFESQFHAGLDHRHQQNAVVVVFLLADGADVLAAFQTQSPPLLPATSAGWHRHSPRSSIMVLEKCPVMMSSWCFSLQRAHDVLEFLRQVEGADLCRLDRRSIILVMPPCLRPSVTVSQPYWISLDA